MATKKPDGPPAERVALERKGKAMPYTSVNGNMFSFLDANGSLGLRLPQEARERFMEKHGTGLFMAHGAVMKEYVTVPDHLLQKTNSLKPYFTASLAYASALKAKPNAGAAKKK